MATGLKVARPDMTVIAVGGDGDGFSIGGNQQLIVGFQVFYKKMDVLGLIIHDQYLGLFEVIIHYLVSSREILN